MISPDDLRRLLRADEKDAVLVLVEGRIEVIGAGKLASEPYRGALEVVSRDDLIRRVGEAPSDQELSEQAVALDTAITELGA
ncbi:hypothetical protein BST36_01480 [Mycolicibacterium moriokaense]|jgi:hypothetical protein|uniref:Pyridine nucleotide-disulfide oxidoreductase n=1 Tax=Mycolicibacterium moriokaense TaxID=39691 RepID=A0AAD1H9A5_9MYCO|nr:hypothetical protein [Mycolicibacterium moriokaense]MCV7041007.1 hypothetical protein [Mycolicibacterium moriokaense]ORB27369.1 hypothetical protein BST36_01480 [Mycolicibacterium moriokaense]BBX00566.1 hypothetical protein MMOR_15020 [Mycolicibacterium moriokaense]